MANCAVGISFGSEFSVVAVTNTSGNPQVYANADGDRITPTYTAFIDGEVLHGNAARSAFVRQPVQTIPYLLPLLSTEIVNEGHFQPKCEVEVMPDPKTGEERVVLPTVDCDGVLPAVLPRNPQDSDDLTNPHTSAELMVSFLNDLKAKTIDGPCSGRAIGCLCVAVPRYMDQATVRSAIEGAGIAKEVRVIYDDVATVLAHQIGNTGGANIGPNAVMLRDRTDILVVDWGANVLSASILRLEGGVFRLISHSHRYNAGGTSLDKHLAKQCCDTFFKKTKINASENGRSIRKILLVLENVRKTLTMSTVCPIDVEAFCDGMDFKDTLSRVKLDMAIRDCGLIEKLNAVLKEMVEMIDPSETINVQHVVLAGGLCRTQYIQQSVKNATANLVPGAGSATIYDAVAADEAAALGACTEAFLTTASVAALSKLPAEVPLDAKYRPVDAAVKDVDVVDVEALEAAIALYVGSGPFSKAATLVDGSKALDAAASLMSISSPTAAAAQKEFGTAAAERGVYEIAHDQLYTIAARGAPMPVSSPLIEAAVGAAVLPVAVISTNETHSYVVPLFTKPYKLDTASFKLLVASEKNGSVTAVSLVEQTEDGDAKVATRSEW